MRWRRALAIAAVAGAACHGDPPPVPRAVGTVVVEPPLDPATVATELRGRRIAERVIDQAGLARTADQLVRLVRTRAVPGSRLVEVAVAVAPARDGAPPLDARGAVFVCNQWLDQAVAQELEQTAAPAEDLPRRLPVRVLDACRLRGR